MTARIYDEAKLRKIDEIYAQDMNVFHDNYYGVSGASIEAK
jgi:hypothetical protein